MAAAGAQAHVAQCYKQCNPMQGKVLNVEVTDGRDISTSLFPDCKVTHRAKIPGGSEGVTWLTGAGWLMFVCCICWYLKLRG